MSSSGSEEQASATVEVVLADASAVGRAALARVRAVAAARGFTPSHGPRRANGRGTAERRRSSDGREPAAVGDVLANVIGMAGWTTQVSIGSVRARWAEIVGEEVASHSTPEDLVEKRLVVRAESTAWATQLRLLQGSLLAAVVREVGEGVVEALDVRGPQGRSFARGPRSVRGRGVRDTFG